MRVIEAVELVGCHVFKPTATISASPWRWCASVWPGCVSTHLAAASCVVAAAKVAAADVYRIAKAWQWQTTATELRALR